MRKSQLVVLVGTTLTLIMTACNYPSPQGEPRPWETAAAETITAIQGANAQFTLTETFTPMPSPTETIIPSSTPTPQNPLVLRDTLCWAGPGSIYEVVSALKTDTRVVLLGRSSNGGYWIVDNPIYHDPCWVSDRDLQLDPGTITTNLKVFTPPPTYTPIPPTPTYTPTP